MNLGQTYPRLDIIVSLEDSEEEESEEDEGLTPIFSDDIGLDDY